MSATLSPQEAITRSFDRCNRLNRQIVRWAWATFGIIVAFLMLISFACGVAYQANLHPVQQHAVVEYSSIRL